MLSTLLLVGCALITKQKDFDVDLPLFEEAEEAQLAESLPLEVKLYDERTDWTLPAFVDNEIWGKLLLADAIARRDLGAGFLEVTSDRLVLDADEPGSLTIRYALGSEEEDYGRLHHAVPEPEVAPAACDTTVTDTTTADEHAADVLACLRAWSDANGAPMLLSITAEVIDATLDDYAVDLALALQTDRATEITCTGRLGVTEELQAEKDNVDFETLDIGGYAVAVDHGMDFVAFANTFDTSTAYDPSAGATAAAGIAAGTGQRVGASIPVEPLPDGIGVSGDVPLDYFPGSNDSWREASVASLEKPDGYVEACWVAAHDTDPNEAIVAFSLVGEGHYDGRE